MLILRLRKCSKRQDGASQFRRRIKWFVIWLIMQTWFHMESVLDQPPTSAGVRESPYWVLMTGWSGAELEGVWSCICSAAGPPGPQNLAPAGGSQNLLRCSWHRRRLRCQESPVLQKEKKIVYSYVAYKAVNQMLLWFDKTYLSHQRWLAPAHIPHQDPPPGCVWPWLSKWQLASCPDWSTI